MKRFNGCQTFLENYIIKRVYFIPLYIQELYQNITLQSKTNLLSVSVSIKHQ